MFDPAPDANSGPLFQPAADAGAGKDGSKEGRLQANSSPARGRHPVLREGDYFFSVHSAVKR